MKKIFWVIAFLALVAPVATVTAGTVENEKAFLTELKQVIPADHIVSVEKLHEKWREVQQGTSKAMIIDVRTRDEFDTGHILNSNNIDSGHAYTVPKNFPDENTEMWIFCRTEHRASYFAALLYKYGYKNVYLVNGGVVAWAEKGYPLVNEYLGEIKVTAYSKKLKEEFTFREGH